MGSLGIWGKFSCPTLKFSFHHDLLSLLFPLMCFHSSDLNEFDLDLQVRPDDVCSQVGLCYAKRGQSERLGFFFSIIFNKHFNISMFCMPFSSYLIQCASIG